MGLVFTPLLRLYYLKWFIFFFNDEIEFIGGSEHANSIIEIAVTLARKVESLLHLEGVMCNITPYVHYALWTRINDPLAYFTVLHSKTQAMRQCARLLCVELTRAILRTQQSLFLERFNRKILVLSGCRDFPRWCDRNYCMYLERKSNCGRERYCSRSQ